MFNKILIANRGEIACRIIKTARRLGIETVAVYSIADKDSLHISLADHAFCIGDAPATSSYLNIDTIISTALACGAQAIHPGYGFLSENPTFAQACENANIVFIGPSISAMEAMASKQIAKQLLENTGVPLTPGYHGKTQTDEQLLAAAKKLGFPVLLKAASGGGGKGMRTVHQMDDFLKDLAGARREAKASFGDDTMLIEKLIINPRHVEMQIMADHHGNIVHLFERDCSIQRRHQKIIEEAPAPHLDDALRQKLATAAIAVARAIEYRGAGTIEFLVDQSHQFYFMEMNTRLQVEHPVTEMITGLDLVEWQLRIAANEPLPCQQKDITAHGHAIECRIYAEDPACDFLPSIGEITFLEEPNNIGIRLDTGITSGSSISMYYDPMMAKLIAWGESRDQALQRLEQALKHYHIGGVKTNIPFLQAILSLPAFRQARLGTHFLSDFPLTIKTPDEKLASMMAASIDYLMLIANTQDSLRRDTFSWKMHLPSHWSSCYVLHGESHKLQLSAISPETLDICLDDKTCRVRIKLANKRLEFTHHHQTYHVLVDCLPDKIILYTEYGPLTVERFSWKQFEQSQNHSNNQLTAPMPATVVAILKNKGDKIKAGERFMVLEAMKMEHTILAPHDGLLVDIFFDVGAQVNEGAPLGNIIDSTE